MAIVKHIYQRTITRKGKKIKVWYYWYKDADGKVIRRSCGQNKKPCLTKREAQSFVANINDEDLCIAPDYITIGQFAAGMYDEKSPYLIKMKNRGIIYTEHTIKIKKDLLNQYILPKWGKCDPNKISNKEIENWLLEYERSNSWRNQIINIIKTIYKELYENQLIDNIPVFFKFKINNVSNTGIFTKEEIAKLFPIDNYEELIKIWKSPRESRDRAFMFATIFYMTLTMGLRSGEIRAIHLDQIKDNYLLLNRMIDSCDKEVNYLKKGSESNKKWRLVIIPQKTKQLLDTYIQQKKIKNPSDYVFELNGSPITRSFLCTHFQNCLAQNGIDYKQRNIHFHSLRFTCNSMLRHHIPEDLLRYMIGHTSVNMTDYYDKSDIEMKEDILSTQLENINKVW